jgi:hypothetical protein
MIRVYDSVTGRFVEATELPGDGWIDVDDPSAAERARLADLKIPSELVEHALDPHELPRTVRRGEAYVGGSPLDRNLR